MNRIVEQREPITVVLASNDNVNKLGKYEWKIAENYVKVLKPFEEVTFMLSASRYPTLSIVIPVLNILKHQINQSEWVIWGNKLVQT